MNLLAFVVGFGIMGIVMVDGLGVNWGTMATHKLPPKKVVQMLKDNNINKVKLFDADETTMSALSGSGLEVMVAIPNDQLKVMGSYDRAKDWVHKNVTRYNFNGGVNITLVSFSLCLLYIGSNVFGCEINSLKMLIW